MYPGFRGGKIMTICVDLTPTPTNNEVANGTVTRDSTGEKVDNSNQQFMDLVKKTEELVQRIQILEKQGRLKSIRKKHEISWKRSIISSVLQYVFFVNFIVATSYFIDLIADDSDDQGGVWNRYKISFIASTIPALSSFGKGWAIFADSWSLWKEKKTNPEVTIDCDPEKY
jgi:hypothetical protein